MTLKKIIAIPLIFLILIGLTVSVVLFYNRNQNENSTNSSKLKITTSFYPLYFFTKEIGGDLVELTNITPNGAEPHDYEPSTKQIQDLYKSKLFVYNGAGVDSWAEKVEPELVKNNLKIVKFSANLELLKGVEEEGHSEEKSNQRDEELDPHIWLDPILVKAQSKNIKDRLIELDSNNKQEYEKKFQNFSTKLDKLDNDYKVKLSTCGKNEIITSHNFLQYLAKRYNFTSIPISGLSPESEPSSQDLAAITKLVKETGLKYIFSETLSSSKLSETIAKETGASILTLNPIEGLTESETKENQDYFSIQYRNLDNLTIAMECR